MLDFNRNLKREQDQLCAKRGLQENSDVQTFNIFLSRAVRERYELTTNPDPNPDPDPTLTVTVTLTPTPTLTLTLTTQPSPSP